MDIANHLKDLLPDLEMMYIEQDMPRVSLQVESSPEMIALHPNHHLLKSRSESLRRCFDFPLVSVP